MKTKLSAKLLTVSLSALILLSGCAQTSPGSTANPSETQTTPGTTATEGSSESAAVPSGDRTLLVYSTQGSGERGDWIVARAKKDMNIDVQFLSGGAGELADRLRAEKNNPQADVVLGMIQLSSYQLKNEGILLPYTPKWANGLPDVYKDKDGYFCSFWQTPVILAYNPNYISPDKAPKSWLDLDKPEYKDKFNMGNLTSQTTRTYIAGILWNFYDPATGDISQKGWDYLSNVYKNSRSQPVKNADEVWKLMSDGTAPLILSWYGGVKTNTEANNISVQYVTPEKGTPVVAETIAVVKGTKKEALAHEFIDWFGSAQVMADFARQFNQAPAHPDAIALCPDEIKKDATMFQAQEIDWSVAATKMDSWMEKIELEIMP